MHHLGPDRPSISTPYARKCSHYTFGRSKSPTRLSGGWRRIVRQPSDAPPGPDRPSISTPYARKCSHGHMYYLLDTFGRSKSPTRLSGGWRRIVRQPSDAPPRARSTDKFLSIRINVPTGTCTTCLMFPGPVDLHSIRTKMFIPSAGRNRPRLSGGWRRIVRQFLMTLASIDRRSPLHTHENVPTDTCTRLKPSAGRNRPLD